MRKLSHQGISECNVTGRHARMMLGRVNTCGESPEVPPSLVALLSSSLWVF